MGFLDKLFKGLFKKSKRAAVRDLKKFNKNRDVLAKHKRKPKRKGLFG